LSEPAVTSGVDADELVPGALIRAVRVWQGLDQVTFAECFKVSRRTVIRWENSGNCFSRSEKTFHAQLWAWMLKRYRDSGVT